MFFFTRTHPHTHTFTYFPALIPIFLNVKVYYHLGKSCKVFKEVLCKMMMYAMQFLLSSHIIMLNKVFFVVVVVLEPYTLKFVS